MKIKPVFRATASALALVSLIACEQQTSGKPADNGNIPSDDAVASTESIYIAATASANRPEADRASDAGRKPAAVLEFVGIEPGMTVLDMFSGSGWYAEIIANVVGDSGQVIAHSNEAYKGFVGNALEERFGGERVGNVEVLMAENNHLSLAENSLDAVMMAQSFHDLYHVDIENKWEAIDGVAFLAELKKGLKPGGIVAIIDHRAAAGSPSETGETLHRIDPELVVANMEAAGFICEATSDILSNPDDDLSKSVFAEGIRGKTDRFVMRFRNPK